MAETLGELAAALRRAASEIDAHGAMDCAQEAGHEFLVALRSSTPVLTGALRASERIDSLRGGGTDATATIGAHTVYARFRNDGGTITVKRASVLTNGTEFFGKSVTQAGSHYFETAETRAGPEIKAACQRVIDRILHDAGL